MKPASARNRELAQIHIAKAQLGLDEETYRAVLKMIGRVESSADLDFSGRKRVLDHFKARGWKPRGSRGGISRGSSAEDPMSTKIRGLWASLHAAGKVSDPADGALMSFVRRQTGVQALQWANTRQKGQIIEALKAWLARP